MKLLLLPLLVAIFTLSCGTGSGSKESLPKEITPQDGGVSFYQIVWMFSGVLQPQSYTPKQTGGIHSGTGYFLVDVNKLGLSGFVQVVTDKGWVVQNLPIAKGSSYTRMGIKFRLADTAEYPPVGTIQAYVLVTPEPLMEAPEVAQLKEWEVQPKEYNAEGKGNPVTQIPEPPPVSDTFVQGSPTSFIGTKEEWPYGDVFNNKLSNALDMDFPTPISKNFNYCFQKNPLGYNIQAAQNQCGPAATANSLYWLKDTLKDLYDMDIPHKNGKGLGNVNGSGKHDGSLVGALDVSMQRPDIESRKKGSPLPDRNFIEGKLRFLSDNEICLSVKHQDNEMTGDVSAGQLTSKGYGIVTWEWICKEVCKGQDVELGYTHLKGGGHWVKVTGCGHIYGRRFITYVSDHLQTNIDPNDEKGTNQIDFSWVEVGKHDWGVYLPQERAVADIAVSESFPYQELKKPEDICPWLKQSENPQNPPLTEKCSGVDHGVGESYIWVCLEGNFQTGDALTVEFPSLGTSWTNEFTTSSSCVCTPRQTIYSYGSYPYTALLVPTSGSSYSTSGSVSVDSTERACTCP